MDKDEILPTINNLKSKKESLKGYGEVFDVKLPKGFIVTPSEKEIIQKVKQLKEQVIILEGYKNAFNKLEALTQENQNIKTKNKNDSKLIKDSVDSINTALTEIRTSLGSVLLDFKKELSRFSYNYKESIDDLNINISELSSDSESGSEKIDELIKVTGLVVKSIKNIPQPKETKIDIASLETEIKNVSNILNRLEKLLDKPNVVFPETLNLSDKDIDKLVSSMATMLSNIVIPQPPPSSPSFRNSSGGADRASVVQRGAINAIATFSFDGGINDLDDTTTSNVTYIGKEDPEGTWSIMKMDETTGLSFTYASKLNNTSIATYSSAWVVRTSLTYNIFNIAF
jgi:hypothetical protein